LLPGIQHDDGTIGGSNVDPVGRRDRGGVVITRRPKSAAVDFPACTRVAAVDDAAVQKG
jgi:hypothetical protein